MNDGLKIYLRTNYIKAIISNQINFRFNTQSFKKELLLLLLLMIGLNWIRLIVLHRIYRQFVRAISYWYVYISLSHQRCNASIFILYNMYVSFCTPLFLCVCYVCNIIWNRYLSNIKHTTEIFPYPDFSYYHCQFSVYFATIPGTTKLLPIHIYVVHIHERQTCICAGINVTWNGTWYVWW